MMNRSIPALIAMAFIGISCSSPTDSPVISADGTVAPIVTGLRVTSPKGSKQIIPWGNPSYPDLSDPPSSGHVGPGVIPAPERGGFYANNPYPNPTAGTIAFQIALPEEGSLGMWIARARCLGFTGTDADRIGDGTIAAPDTRIVRKLLPDGLVLRAGRYTVEWNGTDDQGKPVPPGYYRMYAMKEGKLLWQDILLYRSLSDLPRDLRMIVSGWK